MLQTKRWILRGIRRLPISSTAIFVSSFSTSSAAISSSRPQLNTGNLYNLSIPLRHPKDFIPLTQQAIQRINTIRIELRHQTTSYQQQLLLLDNISNELCNIMDVAEFCRNAHSSSEFQHAAEESFALLSDFIIDLNADQFLYHDILQPLVQRLEAQKRLSSTASKASISTSTPATIAPTPLPTPVLPSTQPIQLTAEEEFFLYDMQRDFLNQGIHLPPLEQEEMKKLQANVVQQETNWSQNIVNGPEIKQTLHIGPYPSQFHDHFLSLSKWCGRFTKQSQAYERYLSIPIDRRYMTPLLKSLSTTSLRKSLWFESYLQPWSNVSGLHSMLFSRQAAASSLKMPSFLHYSIAKHVNPSPSQIQDILSHLHQATMSKAKEEMAKVASYQQAEVAQNSFFSSSNSNSTSASNNAVMPWDLGFYQQYASADLMQQQSSAAKVSEESISTYLPLNACVDGLQYFSQQLFNIVMEEVALEPHESWTSSSADIRKFHIFDASNQQFLGSCYLDLYHREGKFPGAAHFTIRCGCEAVQWTAKEKLQLDTTHRQTPIVALVFHFQRPSSSQRSYTNSQGQFFSSSSSEPLLSLHDLESLFHEWGHALHSLLSQTKFQHLSGTRGSTDYIEIPSHLMEYFARSPEVIAKFAKHYITGESIPKDLLHHALNKKDFFSGIELQHQLLLSAADQYIFSEDTKKFVLSQQLQNNGEETFLHLLDGINEVQSKFTVLPLVPTASLQENIHEYRDQTHSHRLKQQICQNLSHIPYISFLTHGHFVNYGGSYYSYLFAKMYAAQIWSKLFQEDPLNKDAGEYFRREMLATGCSKDHQEVLSLVGKGGLDPTFYLKQILR